MTPAQAKRAAKKARTRSQQAVRLAERERLFAEEQARWDAAAEASQSNHASHILHNVRAFDCSACAA